MQFLPFVEAFRRLLCKSAVDVWVLHRGVLSCTKAIPLGGASGLQFILKIPVSLARSVHPRAGELHVDIFRQCPSQAELFLSSSDLPKQRSKVTLHKPAHRCESCSTWREQPRVWGLWIPLIPEIPGCLFVSWVGVGQELDNPRLLSAESFNCGIFWVGRDF